MQMSLLQFVGRAVKANDEFVIFLRYGLREPSKDYGYSGLFRLSATTLVRARSTKLLWAIS